MVPTAAVVLYSAIGEPMYFPRYLILTAPAMAVLLAICIITVARRPWLIAGLVVLFVGAAIPDYLFVQRWPYAKEGWDYSQVADVISAHAAPGDCLLADNTVPWRPGPIRDSVLQKKNYWSYTLHRAAKEAQEIGEIDPSVDPEQLAWELDSLLGGANSGFKGDDGPKALERGRRAIRDRLSRAAAPGAPPLRD